MSWRHPETARARAHTRNTHSEETPAHQHSSLKRHTNTAQVSPTHTSPAPPSKRPGRRQLSPLVTPQEHTHTTLVCVGWPPTPHKRTGAPHPEDTRARTHADTPPGDKRQHLGVGTQTREPDTSTHTQARHLQIHSPARAVPATPPLSQPPPTPPRAPAPPAQRARGQ